MFLIIMNQILKMLLLLGTGILCYRTGLIDQKGNRALTNLLLMVVNPAIAITSQQIDYRPDLASGLIATYILAIFTHVAAIIVSRLFVKKDGNPRFDLERFSVVYSNCGFIGIPLVQSVLGSEGVFYLTAYITVFNFFSWTHGVILMTGSTSVKNALRGLMTPMIFACVIGLALFLAQIRLPDILLDSMNYLGSMNTPLAMLIAGVAVAQTNLGEMFKSPRIYLISGLRLLFIPLCMLGILTLLPLPLTVRMVVLIISACPTANSGTAFALKFGKDYRYASEIYAFTTVACLVTIPLLVMIGERLF